LVIYIVGIIGIYYSLYEIYDLNGTSFRKGHISDNQFKVNVSTLPAGIYFVKITELDGNSGSYRFIK